MALFTMAGRIVSTSCCGRDQIMVQQSSASAAIIALLVVGLSNIVRGDDDVRAVPLDRRPVVTGAEVEPLVVERRVRLHDRDEKVERIEAVIVFSEPMPRARGDNEATEAVRHWMQTVRGDLGERIATRFERVIGSDVGLVISSRHYGDGVDHIANMQDAGYERIAQRRTVINARDLFAKAFIKEVRPSGKDLGEAIVRLTFTFDPQPIADDRVRLNGSVEAEVEIIDPILSGRQAIGRLFYAERHWQERTEHEGRLRLWRLNNWSVRIPAEAAASFDSGEPFPAVLTVPVWDEKHALAVMLSGKSIPVIDEALGDPPAEVDLHDEANPGQEGAHVSAHRAHTIDAILGIWEIAYEDSVHGQLEGRVGVFVHDDGTLRMHGFGLDPMEDSNFDRDTPPYRFRLSANVDFDGRTLTVRQDSDYFKRIGLTSVFEFNGTDQLVGEWSYRRERVDSLMVNHRRGKKVYDNPEEKYRPYTATGWERWTRIPQPIVHSITIRPKRPDELDHKKIRRELDPAVMLEVRGKFPAMFIDNDWPRVPEDKRWPGLTHNEWRRTKIGLDDPSLYLSALRYGHQTPIAGDADDESPFLALEVRMPRDVRPGEKVLRLAETRTTWTLSIDNYDEPDPVLLSLAFDQPDPSAENSNVIDPHEDLTVIARYDVSPGDDSYQARIWIERDGRTVHRLPPEASILRRSGEPGTIYATEPLRLEGNAVEAGDDEEPSDDPEGDPSNKTSGYTFKPGDVLVAELDGETARMRLVSQDEDQRMKPSLRFMADAEGASILGESQYVNGEALPALPVGQPFWIEAEYGVRQKEPTKALTLAWHESQVDVTMQRVEGGRYLYRAGPFYIPPHTNSESKADADTDAGTDNAVNEH